MSQVEKMKELRKAQNARYRAKGGDALLEREKMRRAVKRAQRRTEYVELQAVVDTKERDLIRQLIHEILKLRAPTADAVAAPAQAVQRVQELAQSILASVKKGTTCDELEAHVNKSVAAARTAGLKGERNFPGPDQVHLNVVGLQRVYRSFMKTKESLPCDDFAWLRDVKGVRASITGSNSKAITSLSSYIVGVLRWIVGYEDLTEQYRALARVETATRNDRISDNVMSERQVAAYETWDHVVKVFNGIGQASDDKLWLGLNVLFAPRRLDWLQLRLTSIPKATASSLADLKGFPAQPKSNWIVLAGRNMFLVFDDHKMKKIYGRQVFSVTDAPLMSIVKAYIERKKVVEGNYLATASSAQVKGASAFMAGVLRRYFNKKMTQTTLRTSFVTHLNKQPRLTTKTRGQWAEKMGHDITTSLTQYNKVDAP